MRSRSGDNLYQTWQKDWRPKLSRSQLALSLGLTVLALGAVVLHWLLVLSPLHSADLARLDLPYQPWYLAEQPRLVLQEVGPNSVNGNSGGTGARGTGTLPTTPVISRPNLVPQPSDWDAGRLGSAVLAYLNRKRHTMGKSPYSQSNEANDLARSLAERYAAAGPEAVAVEYEQSLLAGGWLWEVWRGCEATFYLSFPDNRIDEMSCSPKVLPAGTVLGVGVARWTDSGVRSVPVFALVWQSKAENGDSR